MHYCRIFHADFYRKRQEFASLQLPHNRDSKTYHAQFCSSLSKQKSCNTRTAPQQREGREHENISVTARLADEYYGWVAATLINQAATAQSSKAASQQILNSIEVY